MSKTFQSLEQYNYKLWFAGNIFASSGLWMQRVAQDWLVLTVLTSGGGFQVGVVTALQFLPILLFSPWAGLAADRLDRRRLIQITQSVTASMGLLLGVLVLTGTAQLWMVYILAFVGGIASGGVELHGFQLCPPHRARIVGCDHRRGRPRLGFHCERGPIFGSCSRARIDAQGRVE